MKRWLQVMTVVLLAVCLIVPAATADEEWADYENGRFGYSVQYPEIYTRTKEPDNGDGVWMSARGGYELTLSGGYNVLGETAEDILASRLEQVSHLVSDSDEFDSDWYRIVYSDDGGKNGKERHFHEFGRVDEESWASFILVYPVEKRERFEEIAAVMEDTLRLASCQDDGAGNGIRAEAFSIRDGKLFLDDEALDCEVYDTPDWLDNELAYWAVIGPDVSDSIHEEETGIWFFGVEGGGALGFIPLDSVFEYPEVIWSPAQDRLAIIRGGTRPDLFLEIYSEGMEKTAEFSCLRGSAMWLSDGMRLVFTRIDDIREEGLYPGRSYGFRFSVVLYDSALDESFVLKEATDTKNFVVYDVSADDDEIVITEISVKSQKDWKNEDRIKERELRIPAPAAG